MYVTLTRGGRINNKELATAPAPAPLRQPGTPPTASYRPDRIERLTTRATIG